MGQAAGMGQQPLLGVILQRSALLACATAAGPLLAWAWAPALLRALGQQPELAQLAGTYVQLLSPALLLSGANTVLTTYLAMQVGVLLPAGRFRVSDLEGLGAAFEVLSRLPVTLSA